MNLITKLQKTKDHNSNADLSKARAALLTERHKMDKACWGLHDEILHNLDIEKKHKIDKFSDLIMSDPFKPSKGLTLALKHARKHNFYNPVYEDYTEAKTRFIPTRKLCRQMIRATVMFGKEPRGEFFSRFGLQE